MERGRRNVESQKSLITLFSTSTSEPCFRGLLKKRRFPTCITFATPINARELPYFAFIERFSRPEQRRHLGKAISASQREFLPRNAVSRALQEPANVFRRCCLQSRIQHVSIAGQFSPAEYRRGKSPRTRSFRSFNAFRRRPDTVQKG